MTSQQARLPWALVIEAIGSSARSCDGQSGSNGTSSVPQSVIWTARPLPFGSAALRLPSPVTHEQAMPQRPNRTTRWGPVSTSIGD